jgi:hypothetical protein
MWCPDPIPCRPQASQCLFHLSIQGKGPVQPFPRVGLGLQETVKFEHDLLEAFIHAAAAVPLHQGQERPVLV